MGFLGKIFGGNKRNDRLAAWGKSIPLTEPQKSAMHILWLSAQRKSPPPVDPLTILLNDDDRAYLKKISRADFRPQEFGSADALRLASLKHFKDLGFSNDQAAILVGMMFNMVGRPDL